MTGRSEDLRFGGVFIDMFHQPLFYDNMWGCSYTFVGEYAPVYTKASDISRDDWHVSVKVDNSAAVKYSSE